MAKINQRNTNEKPERKPQPPLTKPTPTEIRDAYADMRRERPEPSYARAYDYDGEDED